MSLDLIKRTLTAEDFRSALSHWQWIEDLPQLEPMFASLFGDVVLAGPNGSRWFLDTYDGTIRRTWASQDEMAAELATPDGADDYLLAGLAYALDDAGMTLEDPEVFAFAVHPVLGGPVEIDNIRALNFVAVHAFLGQVHQQVQTLPPGTQITGLTVDGETP